MQTRIKALLQKSDSWFFALYCVFFSFWAYFSMYAFRKPFSVGKFEGSAELGFVGLVDWKILFILAQVLGYMVSKFLGIKFVAESRFSGRGKQILGLIVLAELSLLGFALVPNAWKSLFLFINGLPLGMIWGLVFGYLEGRKLSALFGAALSASFIVSSGVVKSVGRSLLVSGISESWMPFITGLLFLPPLAACVWFLNQLPPPTAAEEQARVRRQPMSPRDRRAFVGKYWLAISLLTALYMVLTAFRDFRDNFAREIWEALGNSAAEVFSATEIPIAIVVLVLLSTLVRLRDARRSFRVTYALMALGVALIGASTAAFQLQLLRPGLWMTLSGLGLFVAYVPFGCIFYDDWIAASGFVGTAGFMIYVSDAFGYLGSVSLLLYKNFAQPKLPWLNFFVGFSYFTCAFCLLGFGFAWLALRRSELALHRGKDAPQ
jgi:hypothetical protein